MRRFLAVTVVLVAFAAFAGATPGHAASVVPLGFDRIVAESEIVVEGRVVDIRNHYTGTDVRQSRSKTHSSPASDPGAGGATAGAAPRTLGVEGGRMLFTEVTLSPSTEIVGSVGSTVTFRVAGGSDADGTVTVFGMPRFQLGERYVVFLRRGFAASGAPIVGVNQGYFRLAQLPDTGQEALLNADGDVLLGVENNRFVTRHNQERGARLAPRMGDPPVPARGSRVNAGVSDQARQYWSSTAAPMPLTALVSAVRAAQEDTP